MFLALTLGRIRASSLPGHVMNVFVFPANKQDIKKLTEIDVRLNKNWEDGRGRT